MSGIGIDHNRYKHGHSMNGGSKTYHAWLSMRSRCYDKNARSYKDYGARGIKVCARWKESFENFLADMGECPADLQIDRINNNGNYEPDNCRWTDAQTNCSNRRSSRIITHDGIAKTLAGWARYSGIAIDALHRRLETYGWKFERAINEPVQKRTDNRIGTRAAKTYSSSKKAIDARLRYQKAKKSRKQI